MAVSAPQVEGSEACLGAKPEVACSTHLGSQVFVFGLEVIAVSPLAKPGGGIIDELIISADQSEVTYLVRDTCIQVIRGCHTVTVCHIFIVDNRVGIVRRIGRCVI